MAGNLLTKKYHISDTDSGTIMGQYQIIAGVTKPFVVIFTYFFGSRGFIILLSSTVSTICVFVIGMADSEEADLVKCMMIVLPIMTGLYYPVYFASLSLSCPLVGVELAMALSV